MAGVPVSTTHTITGAIIGVGATRRLSAVRWGVAGQIVWAWILTIPASAAIASGLWGIENKLDPGNPVAGNSYERKHPAKAQLPRTLMEAAGRLKASKPARSLFGDAFVDHYSATREWEEREFRKAITDWELDRYMEII